jgi:hypothetical protein
LKTVIFIEFYKEMSPYISIKILSMHADFWYKRAWNSDRTRQRQSKEREREKRVERETDKRGNRNK